MVMFFVPNVLSSTTFLRVANQEVIRRMMVVEFLEFVLGLSRRMLKNLV